jgi:hypothetical protein
MLARIGLCVLAACALASASPAQQETDLLDRIAVTVGKNAITETEVLDEIRVTAVLNGDPLDFSPKARREAAERLVDQQLIRSDMKAVSYPEPENSEAERMLAEFRQQRFRSDGEYREALRQHGVGEEQLKAHLLWQLAALRFTDYRFRAGVPQPGEVLRRHLERESKDRAEVEAARQPASGDGRASGTRRDQPPPDERALPHGIDRQMADWLDQARQRTRIRFHEEVFQ